MPRSPYLAYGPAGEAQGPSAGRTLRHDPDIVENDPVMHPLVAKLHGTDRRSIGRSEEVVADVLADPGQFPLLFDAMLVSDPLVRMRAADAVEKITRRRPDLLQGLQNRVLTEVAAIDQQEVRWHVAQLLPRLALTPPQRAQAITILRGFLDDDSWIVRTFAMQALCDLAEHDEQARGWVLPLLAELTRTGTPAMGSRGRKLLARLEQPGLGRVPAGGTSRAMTQAGKDARE